MIVAGPSGTGKSTLIEALIQGRAHTVAERLDIPSPAPWPVLSMSNFHNLGRLQVDRLFLHLELIRYFGVAGSKSAPRKWIRLLEIADRTDVLTIWCAPEVLLRQHREAKLRLASQRPGHAERLRGLYAFKENFYADPGLVAKLYRAWFDHLDTLGVAHTIVNLTEGVRFYSREEWERATRPHEVSAV